MLVPGDVCLQGPLPSKTTPSHSLSLCSNATFPPRPRSGLSSYLNCSLPPLHQTPGSPLACRGFLQIHCHHLSWWAFYFRCLIFQPPPLHPMQRQALAEKLQCTTPSAAPTDAQGALKQHLLTRELRFRDKLPLSPVALFGSCSVFPICVLYLGIIQSFSHGS